jgi:hypothetical protein
VREQPRLELGGVVDFVATELTEAPELWHQRGYLARVVTVDPGSGLVDAGVQPLTHVLDTEGPDSLAITLESDGSGALYPVLYTRIGGVTKEHVLDPDPLLRYDRPETRQAIASALSALIPGLTTD